MVAGSAETRALQLPGSTWGNLAQMPRLLKTGQEPRRCFVSMSSEYVLLPQSKRISPTYQKRSFYQTTHSSVNLDIYSLSATRSPQLVACPFDLEQWQTNFVLSSNLSRFKPNTSAPATQTQLDTNGPATLSATHTPATLAIRLCLPTWRWEWGRARRSSGAT